jgi:hypothetical protein
MMKALKIAVLMPLILLILVNVHVANALPLTTSIPSGNLITPVPTATLTDDQQSFAPPILLVPFITLPLVVLGLCGTMLLLVVVFILVNRTKFCLGIANGCSSGIDPRGRRVYESAEL